jgi:hypothetical protein
MSSSDRKVAGLLVSVGPSTFDLVTTIDHFRGPEVSGRHTMRGSRRQHSAVQLDVATSHDDAQRYSSQTGTGVRDEEGNDRSALDPACSPEADGSCSYESTSSIGAAVAARTTDSQPFFAAALVSYASPVATTWPLLAFSLNRNLPERSL